MKIRNHGNQFYNFFDQICFCNVSYLLFPPICTLFLGMSFLSTVVTNPTLLGVIGRVIDLVIGFRIFLLDSTKFLKLVIFLNARPNVIHFSIIFNRM